MHPQPRVRFVVGVCTRVFTAEAPETSGIPHAMVLRLITRSPRGPGFLAPVIPEKLASQELDASVGASGPHAFAVRISTARLATPLRPPHPASYVRDDRDTPLLWRRDGMENTQFLIFGKQNFAAWRADNPNQLESAREIRFYAQANWHRKSPAFEAIVRKIEQILPVARISLQRLVISRRWRIAHMSLVRGRPEVAGWRLERRD
jgi:hypothetical protein